MAIYRCSECGRNVSGPVAVDATEDRIRELEAEMRRIKWLEGELTAAHKRIRELEAECDALKKATQPVSHSENAWFAVCDRIIELEAENQRLRKAIYKHRARITQGSNGDLALWKALEGE